MSCDLSHAPTRKDSEGMPPEDFELRLRSRRMHLLTEWLKHRLGAAVPIDLTVVNSRVQETSDRELLLAVVRLVTPAGVAANEVMHAFERCAAEARRQLLAERPGPTPFHLA